jgi:hypothetical protein
VRAKSTTLTALAIGVLFACGDSLQQSELDCEEAVSVLIGCCPGFQAPQLQCVYDDQGCNGTTYPALSSDDSTCIRSESCASLVKSGVCARAQNAKSYVLGGSDGASSPPAPVCP